jgi:hypothetical protein
VRNVSLCGRSALATVHQSGNTKIRATTQPSAATVQRRRRGWRLVGFSAVTSVVAGGEKPELDHHDEQRDDH